MFALNVLWKAIDFTFLPIKNTPRLKDIPEILHISSSQSQF